MKIIKDKPLIDNIFEYDIILYSMGINNSMHNGFKKEIAVNFPDIVKFENNTNYGDRRKFGGINIYECNNIVFCACYIDRGGYHKNSERIDYKALQECLTKIKEKFDKKKKIALPILGDGYGDKDKIIDIIESLLSDYNITLYDYEQRDYGLYYYQQIAKLHEQHKNKEITNTEYSEKRSKLEWERRYGIYQKMPIDYHYEPKDGIKKQKVKI